MAHITEFTVDGLAGRKGPYSRRLDRHVNVFFGLNGSGKTSLLKIFNAAMSGEVETLRPVPFKNAQLTIYSLDREKSYRYSYTKPEEKELPEVDSAFAETPGVFSYTHVLTIPTQKDGWKVEPEEDPTSEFQWSHTYLPVNRLYLPETYSRARHFSSSNPESEASDALEESFAVLINQLWSTYSADVFGTVQRAQAKGLADILIAILTGRSSSDRVSGQLDAPEAYARVSRFFERQGARQLLGDPNAFQDNYRSNPQLRSVANDLGSVEVEIQKAMAPRDQLQSLIQRMYTGNKVVSFTDSLIDIRGQNKEKIGLSRLSSGEKQLLRIFVAALMVGRSSLIVDEPELSMHVDWQRQLIGAIRQLNGESQIIAATHAPEIMADLPDENIFRL